MIQTAQFLASTIANPDYKFSKLTGETDFHLMISKDQEEMHKKLSDENTELKNCLRLLQNEMMEIVSLKQDTFQRRFKVEYGAHKEPGPETEEALTH